MKVEVQNLEYQNTKQSYRAQIIDSKYTSTLDLTQQNLNWCCDDNLTLDKPQSVYSIKASKKLKRTIFHLNT